ncbi:PIR protein [Plasmodium yoelii yoelii]|uniref:PIR protein n=1 Tax=Plasmodium yoelii yoelii TaxID=73239 RepID=A0AAE9X033_PLAYO|nr:PIR protein [Plasmodium yoelii yoelii]WBY59582.1 PIR protein [Plasmodium yoelii yoelii]
MDLTFGIAFLIENQENMNVRTFFMELKNNAGTNNLTYFYSTFINSDNKYNKAIKDATDYKSYKDLIDKKQNLMNMNMRIIFKFYDAFKILCNMYNEYKKENTNCKNYLKKDKEFVEKYEELNKDPKLLKTVLVIKCSGVNCSNFSSFPSIEKAQISEVISSSSITNKLFIVLSIFGAIAIFLGISYKYSLFRSRKRD